MEQDLQPKNLHAFIDLTDEQRAKLVDYLGPIYDKEQSNLPVETAIAFDILLESLGRPGHYAT